jgi:hypothetical protein
MELSLSFEARPPPLGIADLLGAIGLLGAADLLGAPSAPVRPALLDVVPDPAVGVCLLLLPPCGCFAPESAVGFSVALAALAARCFSCSSLRSAFVIDFWDFEAGCPAEVLDSEGSPVGGAAEDVDAIIVYSRWKRAIQNKGYEAGSRAIIVIWRLEYKIEARVSKI